MNATDFLAKDALARFTDPSFDAPEKAAKFLKSLAHPDRLKVLCCLMEDELSVAEIEDKVGASQSSISQHLGRFRTEGIVTSRREGRQIFYKIEDPTVLGILSVLYTRFCDTDD